LQIVDASTGELSGRGIFLVSESTMGVPHSYPVGHTLSVEVKDGKYRYTLTKFSVDDPRSPFAIENIPYVSKKFLERFYEKVDNNSIALLESLPKALSTVDDF
jgi:hypothetical protein